MHLRCKALAYMHMKIDTPRDALSVPFPRVRQGAAARARCPCTACVPRPFLSTWMHAYAARPAVWRRPILHLLTLLASAHCCVRAPHAAASKASQPVPVPSAGAKAASASPDGGAAAAAGTGTSPIDIDARKEVNKVRSSLTVGPKKDRRYGRAGGMPACGSWVHGASWSPDYYSAVFSWHTG